MDSDNKDVKCDMWDRRPRRRSEKLNNQMKGSYLPPKSRGRTYNSNLDITHPILLISHALHPPHLHHNRHMTMDTHPLRIGAP
jgi:hypothetical protein